MKTIIFLITFFICAIGISAQTNYYETAKSFNEVGYVYQCDVLKDAGFVTLYNKENKLLHIEKVYRSTGKPTTIKDSMSKRYLEDDNWTKSKSYLIVNNAFSNNEKQRVKGHKVSISMYIDSDSGKILEVKFQFVNFGPYATIPVSVYRNIETELKKNVWFTPSVEGKKLNYIFHSWLQEVK